ncbi:MAG: thiamine-phosphate pyrophosphorylase [Candidatus Omnitrophota bacterium]
MKKITKELIYRILDANLNRAVEGMRVCEELTRFVLNSRKLTAQLKILRHQISRTANTSMRQALIKGRNSRGDVGRCLIKGELERKNCQDVFFANMQRVKESIRALEEFYKLIDKKAAIRLKALRYNAYEAEKKIILKFAALSNIK